jgi:hypothetical protein
MQVYASPGDVAVTLILSATGNKLPRRVVAVGQGVLTGRTASLDGEPLPDVSVEVQGASSNTRVSSDEAGNFQLTLPAGHYFVSSPGRAEGPLQSRTAPSAMGVESGAFENKVEIVAGYETGPLELRLKTFRIYNVAVRVTEWYRPAAVQC